MCAKLFKYDVRRLIEYVKVQPCIWDKNLDIYKDKVERRAAWERIFRKLEPEYDNMSSEHKRMLGEAIVEKWSRLRDTFLRTMKEATAAKDGTPVRKYVYHDDMLFLTNVYPEFEFLQFTNPNELYISLGGDDCSDKVNAKRTMSKIDLKFQILRLIELVKEHRVLWNKNEKGSFYMRKAAWKEICRNLVDAYDDLPQEDKDNIELAIINKWTNVRDTFVRSLKPSPDGRTRKKYVYHNQLLFLLSLFPELVNAENDITHYDISDDNETYKQEQDSFQEIEIYTNSANLNSDDSDEYQAQPVQKRKKTKNKSFGSEISITKDPFAPDETEVVEVSGSESRVMNEDEAFFASLLPTVVRYNEDERLEFRIKVLAVMKEIRDKSSL